MLDKNKHNLWRYIYESPAQNLANLVCLPNLIQEVLTDITLLAVSLRFF